MYVSCSVLRTTSGALFMPMEEAGEFDARLLVLRGRSPGLDMGIGSWSRLYPGDGVYSIGETYSISCMAVLV